MVLLFPKQQHKKLKPGEKPLQGPIQPGIKDNNGEFHEGCLLFDLREKLFAHVDLQLAGILGKRERARCIDLSYCAESKSLVSDA